MKTPEAKRAANRKRFRRWYASQKAERVAFCLYCKEQIINPSAAQKYHRVDCAKAAHLASARERQKKKRDAKPPYHRTCECGTKFTTKNRRRIHCLDRLCTNRRNRERRAEQKAKGIELGIISLPKSKIYNKEAAKEARKLVAKPAQRIKARCPGGHEHTIRCEYGYTGTLRVPWINCTDYPYCVQRDEREPTYSAAGWERGNAAFL